LDKGNGKRKKALAPDPLSNKQYASALKDLHIELVRLQEWVERAGLKVCVVFEGRDGAGKGGMIKAITERVSPRVFLLKSVPHKAAPRVKVKLPKRQKPGKYRETNYPFKFIPETV
jgi:polyphosphate kinase 2 (PPK2 family)